MLREQKEISFYEKNILQIMANQNNIPIHNDGSHDISFKQWESVAELLTKNNYNWNISVNGNAICVNASEQIQFGNIIIKILNPTQATLNELANTWIASLKSRCRPVIINDNHLFDDAFEGAYINEHDDWVTIVKEISYNNKYDWKTLADQPADTRTVIFRNTFFMSGSMMPWRQMKILSQPRNMTIRFFRFHGNIPCHYGHYLRQGGLKNKKNFRCIYIAIPENVYGTGMHL